MAKELSQGELLDFLCQAGGRVLNAALLGHFKGFLRDPAASPGELQRRRHLFKGFVNSVATVKQEAPGGAKYVVLRKRYRELVGEEPPKTPEAAGSPGAGEAPLDGPGSREPGEECAAAPRAHGGHGGGECLGKRAEEEEERPESRTCPGWAPDLRACPELGRELALPGGARLSAGPAPSGIQTRCALLGGEPRSQKNGARGSPGDLETLRDWAPPPPPPKGPALAVGGATADHGGLHQRVGAWIASAQEVALPPDCGFDPGLWSAPSPYLAPALEAQLSHGAGLEEWRERRPIFRSIRCQLSLQDLDEFLEQESPTSEDSSSSSASGGSDARGEGGAGFLRQIPAGGPNGNPLGIGLAKAGEGLRCAPQFNGLVEPPAKVRGSQPRKVAPLGQISRGSSSEDELLDKDPQRLSRQLRKPQRVTCQCPPNLDAPLSPYLAPRQGPPNSTPALEGPGPDTDGSPERRSSSVPLEPREHAWLVKVAAGSWMQVRALFLEDPHLATCKDFISGYTVLHWLAKHGNSQVLLDLVAGARKAGVALDVNVRSGCGYTPLHLAAMHGHQLVIRLLVQKLHSQVHVRDSSGKKPWQYLSSSTSGEIWHLLGAPKGKTIFPARPIARSSPPTRRGKSPELARKISRKTSLAAYLKPQHVKWKMTHKYPALPEREEYSD